MSGDSKDVDISRYSRQMLVFGKKTQDKLKELKVLVVGAGALGCSCISYLVGAGVGLISIFDGDTVEITNLHRQILYTEKDVKKNKAEVAAERLSLCNSQIKIVSIAEHCTFDKKSMRIINNHDLICDCSDNIGTRYLLNDACFLLKKILVSAAAIGNEGSISVYNFQQNIINSHNNTALSGCYRCAHPEPSSGEGRRRCADTGVLGPVPGILGSMQALAVIDICRSIQRYDDIRIFDGATLRSFKRAPRRSNCILCGDHPTIHNIAHTKQNCQNFGICVEISNKNSCCFGALLKRTSPSSPLPPEAEISCTDLALKLKCSTPLLIDVRDNRQFSICSLPQANSLPLREILLRTPQATAEEIKRLLIISEGTAGPKASSSLFVLCRRGVDSVTATRHLRQQVVPFLPQNLTIQNVTGGLDAWRAQIDPTFPTCTFLISLFSLTVSISTHTYYSELTLEQT